jgi:TolB protein
MQHRKVGGIWLWGVCALMSIPPSALAADRPKESVASIRSTEPHLTNIRQLTFGRQNAEAYFSFNGTKLIFQSTNNWVTDSPASLRKPAESGLGCYQMYVMDVENETVHLVSTGKGATTCGYFFPPFCRARLPAKTQTRWCLPMGTRRLRYLRRKSRRSEHAEADDVTRV